MSADGADMELDSLLRLLSASGRPGTIGLGPVVLGASALQSLASVVAKVAASPRIVVLEDATPMRRGPELLKPLVADLLAPVGSVERIVLGPADGALHADSETIAAATAAAEGAGCVVTVGSGTLTDVGKEAARSVGAPLVAIQTAASVNGFANAMAVILKDGVKRTVPSIWPAALVIDTQVLAASPPSMTSSGFGEMMSMFTAPADWRLAQAAGSDDSFDPAIVELFRPRGEKLLASSSALRAGNDGALMLLASLLTASGVAMGAAGRTAPLSGMEHLISHLLDMSADADGRRVGLHGAQVGVAALVAACLWERLTARFDPRDLDLPVPSDERMQQEIERAFCGIDPGGAMAAECWSDYSRKLGAWRRDDDRREALAGSWEAVKADVRPLLGAPEAIATALRLAGAPTRFSELAPPVGADRTRWAVASCHLMRSRFTIADLAFFSGHWQEADVDAVLKRAADLGGGL